MPNNTRARSNQLAALAAEIAARDGVDVTNPPTGEQRRAIVREISERGECLRETALNVWTRYLRRTRHGLAPQWGGNRGGGRPRK